MTLQSVDTLGSDSAPTAILDRVSLVLDAFEGPGRLTLAQIVRRTGLPRSSAHRMLERLVSMRWLRREGRDYELGMRLVELGSLAVHQDRLHSAAMPLLHELYRVTGLVVHLGILDRSDVVYLEKIGGRLGAAVPTRVGGRRLASSTAIGQALLAYGSGPHPQAARIQEAGVAYESGRGLAGFSCLAAPIGPVGRAVAAVSICGPTQALRNDHITAAPVRMAAAAIWRAIDGGALTVTPTLQRRQMLRNLPTAAGA
ncbi:IclR family transcriptional regulator [Rhodococcus sp. IEGM 1379]|uniref:IclR family transcriptional regulator n=1 Tax=Rhodococcus sp. IEGM 1379 TaxID=3047086 RepID=UPI0024B79288|nr:IclR family transcriptional regulator [Rhodococcus sp. IEGM 1379]MDI9915123.1 IclR family transcriptional regulator [Rhodococcus sp. IEGM 1379]